MKTPTPFERSLAGLVLLDPSATIHAIDKAGGLPNIVIQDPEAAAVFRAVATETAAGRSITAESLFTACGLPGSRQDVLTDAAGLPSAVGALVSTIREIHAERLARPATVVADLTFGAAVSFKRLSELAHPAPENENPAALFKNGHFRKGHGLMWVASAGVGKSTSMIQAAQGWGLGRSVFGIEPVRPLTVAIFQTEDDAEEVAFFRDQIATGLQQFAGWTKADTDAAAEKVLLFDTCGAVGDGFVSLLRKTLKAHPAIDLVIVNPLQAVFGGDLSRNAELTPFLRAGIDPVLKGPDGAGRVGLVFVHHTNKPPSAKDRAGWGTDAAAAYIGAGGAELSNWARAILSLMPVEDSPGLFRLVAGKRGRRLGWVGPDGLPTCQRLIAHTEGLIYWRDATEAEAETATPKSRKAGDATADAAGLADHLRARACSLTEARAQSEQLYGRARGRRAFDAVKTGLAVHRLTVATADKNGVMFIGTAPEAEALARRYGAKPEKGQ
jgi:hypothetical protein